MEAKPIKFTKDALRNELKENLYEYVDNGAASLLLAGRHKFSDGEDWFQSTIQELNKHPYNSDDE